MIRNLTLALVLAAAACGGKKAAPATTTTTSEQAGPHEEHGSGGEPGEHEGLTPELTKFHDLLAPLWHAAKGPQRIKDTCAAVPQFKAAADAVAKATPPNPTNADTWTTGTRALVASVNDLEAACKTNDAAKFEAAFEKVHHAFHYLMEQTEKHEGSAAPEHKHAGSAAPAPAPAPEHKH
jgi:hypothetical protein